MLNKKGRPQGEKPDAREALIKAARYKFLNKAYDKVSIRELAQYAGVNSAMIKYYFESKEGLYRAMIMEVTGQVIGNIKSRLQSGDFMSVEGFFRSFVDVIKQSPEFPLLMLKEVMLGQGVSRQYLIEQLSQTHVKVIDQVFEHFHAKGRIKAGVDPKMFRMSLMSLTLNPWYMRELLGIIEGVDYDDAFLERLIAHNTLLIEQGFFVGEDHE